MIDVEIKVVQMKNTSNKLLIISKNFGVNYFRNYSKEKCFLTALKNRHFAITLEQKLKLQILKKAAVNTPNMKTILFNEIIVYKNNNIVTKLAAITEKISAI